MDPSASNLDLPGDALRIERVAEVGSTNAELLERSPWPAPAAIWLIAEHQTGGRGRRGRRWVDSPGATLTASLGLELPPDVALGPIPLVVGAALATELVTFGARPLLKWPNDICVRRDNGRLAKAGGILCEMRAAGDGGRLRLVAGCGLNLLASPPAADLPAGRDDEAAPAPAGHLFDALSPNDRPRLEAALGHALLAAVQESVRDGPAAGLARWSGFDVLADQPVRVHAADGAYDTVARGIDEQGRLRVDDPATAGVVRMLLAEEVSIRSTAARLGRAPASLH